MNSNKSAVLIALFCAGVMAVIILYFWSSIQTTLADTAASITAIVTADGTEIAEFVEDYLIASLPITMPIITFVSVYFTILRRERST